MRASSERASPHSQTGVEARRAVGRTFVGNVGREAEYLHAGPSGLADARVRRSSGRTNPVETRRVLLLLRGLDCWPIQAEYRSGCSHARRPSLRHAPAAPAAASPED